MRRSKLLIWICLSLLCCSILIPVNAAGIGDEINNLGNLNLSELFQRYASGTDGALTEGIIYHMGEYFFEDPVAFIRTLAQESSEVQEKIIERAPFPVSMYHDMYPGGHAKFPEAVASIALTEEDSENAHHILQCFRDAVDQYWGTNPKTGDPAGVAAALLAASGAGMVILPKLRRKRDEDA